MDIPKGGYKVSDELYRYKVRGDRWYLHVPSGTWLRNVTRITGKYPADEGLMRWICSHGSYDNYQNALQQAAFRGTAIHRGVEQLHKGRTLVQSEYKHDEWKALLSYQRFMRDHKPEIIAVEEVVYSLKRRLAGTLDLRVRLDGHTVLDIKSSKSGIFRTQMLQVNEYGYLFNSNANGHVVEKAGVLRLGTRHRCGFELKVWDLCEDMHRTFVALHRVDFDMDSSMEPTFPKPQPEQICLEQSERADEKPNGKPHNNGHTNRVVVWE